MAIKAKGIINIDNGLINDDEFCARVDELDDGEYGFLIFDKKSNRLLPILKYLNGIVLKVISEELPTHPPTEALYRYFETMFCEKNEVTIGDTVWRYRNLKTLRTAEIQVIIDKIIDYAKTEWNIDVLKRSELKLSKLSEPYLNAYAEEWKDYSRII